MSDEISTRQVKKFDGSNFQTWKFQLRTALISHGLLEVVTGEKEKPRDTESNEVKAWIKENAKAMFLISSTLEDSQLECLITCVTANEMWTRLSVIHEQRSASSKLILTQKFHEYKMEATDSVIQHISKVQNMAARLKDIGEGVSDVAVMAKILAGLPSKYNALKTAWDSVDAEKQTIANLMERLIKEETRMTTDDETSSALAAVSNSRGKRLGSKDKHDKKEHSSKEQPRLNSRRNMECYYCKKTGHIARECRKKKYDSRNSAESKSTSDCAFIVSSANQNGERKGEPLDELGRKLLGSDIKDIWIADSGASRHITYRRDWFADFQARDGETVTLGDDGTCESKGSGIIRIETMINGEWRESHLENVLYVPTLRKNLFSIGSSVSKGYRVTFNQQCVTFLRGKTEYARGYKHQSQTWWMLFRVKPPQVSVVANLSESLQTWHERMGHVNKRAVVDMIQNNSVTGIKLSDKKDMFCEPCKLGKCHRASFKSQDTRVNREAGEYIHSDVSGPMSTESLGGARFFVTFKDEASSFRQVYFMKHKADVFECFKKFEAIVTNKFGRSMRILRSDNGSEYTNSHLQKYLEEKGICHETTSPYCPEQNGKSERDNRTIVESARTMIHAKQLPRYLWAEATSTAVYILNRTCLGRRDKKTPYEIWHGKKPNVSHLRIFGSEAYVHVEKQFRRKFDAKAKKVLLVGYQDDSHNYRVYDPTTKKISVSRNVYFNEDSRSQIPDTNNQSELKISLEQEDQHIYVTDPEVEDDCSTEDTRRSLRDRNKLQKPSRYQANYVEINPPTTYQEVNTRSDADKWQEAITEELKAHQDNQTWSIIQRPNRCKTIDSKWVFSIRQHEKGNTRGRYKARLCARGFQQRQGLDYTETFAPVVRYDSLRVLLAIVAREDLELIQFDIKTAFLYGELKEDIFMELPEGLKIDSGENDMVCKLNKSLYGLKQAPRCWGEKFRNFLEQFGFVATEADQCIFCGKIENLTVHLALFVDDGLIVAKSYETLMIIIDYLQRSFEITYGKVRNFIGLQIERDRENKSLFIHQSDYIEKILGKFNMINAKAVTIPADPHTILYPAEKEEISDIYVPFQEAVGSLMFIATISRPDIAFITNQLSRYMNNYTNSHWQAVKRVFKYLINTVHLGIEYKFGGSKCQLLGYSDADYANDPGTRRSVTGYAFFFGNGLISWASQRQRLVTLSTTEAEYVAAAAAVKEAIWLKRLLNEIGCQVEDPTTLYVDNLSAIRIIKNPEYHKRTKHIDIRYHFIRERVERGEVSVCHIPSEQQRADIFTKPLPRDNFKRLCRSLGLVFQVGKHSNGGSVGV